MAQAGLGDLSDLKSCYARGPNRGVNRPDLELKKKMRDGGCATRILRMDRSGSRQREKAEE
jgi:hypothetical protein